MIELRGAFGCDERATEKAGFANSPPDHPARESGDELHLGSGEVAAILHNLNNALVSILLNAQVVEFRLPSYSRLKRNLHEVERSAQRAGMLVKRLLEREDGEGPAPLVQPEAEEVRMTATCPEPGVEDREPTSQPRRKDEGGTVQSRSRKKVPHTIV